MLYSEVASTGPTDKLLVEMDRHRLVRHQPKATAYKSTTCTPYFTFLSSKASFSMLNPNVCSLFSQVGSPALSRKLVAVGSYSTSPHNPLGRSARTRSPSARRTTNSHAAQLLRNAAIYRPFFVGGSEIRLKKWLRRATAFWPASTMHSLMYTR